MPYCCVLGWERANKRPLFEPVYLLLEGAALVPDPSLRIPLPLLSGDGQFRLDDTGGQYTLLGYLLAAIINHALTNDKRAASQLAAQIVGLTTGGTLKSQAIDVATMLAHGPRRAFLPQSRHPGADLQPRQAGQASSSGVLRPRLRPRQLLGSTGLSGTPLRRHGAAPR